MPDMLTAYLIQRKLVFSSKFCFVHFCYHLGNVYIRQTSFVGDCIRYCTCARAFGWLVVGSSVVPSEWNDLFSTSPAVWMRVGRKTKPGRTIKTFRPELWGTLSHWLGEVDSGSCWEKPKEWAQKCWRGKGWGKLGETSKRKAQKQGRVPWGSPFATRFLYSRSCKLAIRGLNLAYRWALIGLHRICFKYELIRIWYNSVKSRKILLFLEK